MRAAPTEAAWAGDPALAEAVSPRLFAYFTRYVGRYLPPDRTAHILDFGCGFGSFLAYLEQRGYTKARGVDVDGRCVDFCAGRVSSPVQLVDDSRIFLEEHRSNFDFIYAREVAYYFPPRELDSYFRALGGALRPGGRLVVEVFNGAQATGLYPSLKDRWITMVFTEHSLRAALEAGGLNVTALFGATGAGSGLRYDAWRAAASLWGFLWRAVYLLERGRDALNPTIMDKTIFAVAERRG